ncbi:hypothetical protein DNU06_00825 [Putridiphycobacter roseus]|uniref:BIG2 domain-containing protein n=1 Tax=Putridiphycobacter roseus TaxID=2219161 RepID=A0A2W1N5K5_9FLAO|nr:T9SS type A sorting domain-containing protein [Putridiphycobacter roseus]PZE18411.1 hypothetical protein DNU06_00825 [Putridiphycobacter roseus]
MKNIILSIITLITISLGASAQVSVLSIFVDGQNGVNTINTQAGTLQMEAIVLPTNATNPNYTWNVNNATGYATISTTGILTGLGNGYVQVVATANDGSGTVGTKDIYINFPALVAFIDVHTLSGLSTITTPGGTLFMYADIVPLDAANGSITWSVVPVTGMASISSSGLLTAQANGTVEVRATAQDGSGTEGTKTITISNQTVGLSEVSSPTIQLYPNPVQNLLNIQLPEENIKQVAIYSISGQLVKPVSIMNNKIDVSVLKAGIYILTIETENRLYTNRFIKQ